jgi:protein Mpv17
MRRKNWEEIKHELQIKLMPTMKNSWRLWPFAHLVTFYFIPPQFRMLWLNFVGLNWSIYLSYMAFKKGL